MLQTNLKHVNSKEELQGLITSNEKVAVCCGRMGPMCIPVYDIFEVFQEKYPEIQFRDMDFDIPDASVIRNLPECRKFNGLPFTIYYRNGKVVKATTSLQSANQIKDVIEEVFA
ncbi:MAG: thioredoxin family protein [Anaerolineales bacterium]|nr:thioredoxin family protein [Anaerolineales bacterium]